MNKVADIFSKFVRSNDLEKYFCKKYFDYFLFALAIVFGIYLNWTIGNIFVFTFVVWIILNPVSSQFLAKISLGFFLSVPLFLFMNQGTQTEEFASYTFYFLGLMLIVAFDETRKNSSDS